MKLRNVILRLAEQNDKVQIVILHSKLVQYSIWITSL